MEILKRLKTINDIGNNRQIYNEQWIQTKNFIEQWAKESGLDVSEDAFGNLSCRLRGYNDKQTVAVISHFDSVENGGVYDGLVGILAGIEALSILKKRIGNPEISIEVICICEEEGTRFKTTFLGSRALMGELAFNNLAQLQDEKGISFFEAQKQADRAPVKPEDLPRCQRDDIVKCVELHIEQSAYLYKTNTPIGVATCIPGQMKVRMTSIGEANHAGTTSMFERKDALCCAAKIISFVEQLGIKYEGITTTGYSVNQKNATNVIPSHVELIADLRHPDKKIFNTMLEDLYNYASKQEAQRGVKVEIKKLIKIDPVDMNDRISEEIKLSAKQLGYPCIEIQSGAGHDVQILANKGIETGLIFIPSEHGLSHRPEEYTKDEDIIKGVKVLTQTVRKLAY